MATVMEPEIEARPAAAPGKQAAAQGGRSRIVFLAMGVALLGLLGFGAKRWWFARSHVSTDNAQVDGHIIPILPKVGGFVAEVRVQENQEVKAGDTLVVVDDRDFRSRLAQTEADLAALLATVSSRARVGQAEAAVAQAQANALKARADLARLEPLALQGIVSAQQLDAARAAAAAADAQLAAAQAALVGADARVAASRAARDQAALQLSYTRITAPATGVVSSSSSLQPPVATTRTIIATPVVLSRDLTKFIFFHLPLLFRDAGTRRSRAQARPTPEACAYHEAVQEPPGWRPFASPIALLVKATFPARVEHVAKASDRTETAATETSARACS